MPGPPITPADLAVALDVYLRTGSFTRAAEAIGRNIGATAAALRRNHSDVDRRKVYARELESVMGEAARLQRVALRMLRPMLSDADARVAQGAVAQVNDTSRASGTARTALAKLTGEHAAEKVEVAVDDDALLAKLSRVTGR